MSVLGLAKFEVGLYTASAPGIKSTEWVNANCLETSETAWHVEDDS
jgi:hypothetical protein